jgi:hypothetical protein
LYRQNEKNQKAKLVATKHSGRSAPGHHLNFPNLLRCEHGKFRAMTVAVLAECFDATIQVWVPVCLKPLDFPGQLGYNWDNSSVAQW